MPCIPDLKLWAKKTRLNLLKHRDDPQNAQFTCSFVPVNAPHAQAQICSKIVRQLGCSILLAMRITPSNCAA